MTTSPALKAYRRRWLVAVAVFVALLVAGAVTLRSTAKRVIEESDKHRVEITRRFFNEDLAELKAGKKNDIYFYDTVGTDDLVRQLEGMVEVEELVFELTDLSEAGMASIAKLPRLRKLVLYGGRGINDACIAKLNGMTSLTELELLNRQITHDAIEELRKKLPKCDIRTTRVFK